MSQTAVVERTIAPGISINSSMTGAQILNAHLQAAGEKPLAVANVSFAGPQGHPHTVIPDAQAGATGAKAAPSSKPIEAAKPNANAVANFDAEMRAAGKQLPLERPDLAGGGIDQEGIDALTEQYRALAGPLQGKSDAASMATAARFKTAYEADVRRILDGQQLTAKQIATLKGNLGRADTLVPKTKEAAPAAAPKSAPTVEQWETAHKAVANAEGIARVESFNTEALSGYTLPKYADDWGYPIEIIGQLAAARAAGVTQQQINQFIRTQAVADGWIAA